MMRPVTAATLVWYTLTIGAVVMLFAAALRGDWVTWALWTIAGMGYGVKADQARRARRREVVDD